MDSDRVPPMYSLLLPWFPLRMRFTTLPLRPSHSTPFQRQQSSPVHDSRTPVGSSEMPALKSNNAAWSSSEHSAFCPRHDELNDNIHRSNNPGITPPRFSITRGRMLQRVKRSRAEFGGPNQTKRVK